MIPSRLSLFGFCNTVIAASTMLASDDFPNSNSLVNNNDMPTKMATCRKNKAVLVTVFVEKPRRRALSNHQHHHHHCLHQAIKQELIRQKHGGAGKGYNRRAELLSYSQHLRKSVRSSASTALESKPVSSIDQQPSNKIIDVQGKPKYSKTLACFDNWGIVVPSFLRSLTNLQAKNTGKKKNDGPSATSSNNKIKALMKSMQMQKKWRFFAKPSSMLHKNQHR